MGPSCGLSETQDAWVLPSGCHDIRVVAIAHLSSQGRGSGIHIRGPFSSTKYLLTSSYRGGVAVRPRNMGAIASGPGILNRDARDADRSSPIFQDSSVRWGPRSLGPTAGIGPADHISSTQCGPGPRGLRPSAAPSVGRGAVPGRDLGLGVARARLSPWVGGVSSSTVNADATQRIGVRSSGGATGSCNTGGPGGCSGRNHDWNSRRLSV